MIEIPNTFNDYVVEQYLKDAPDQIDITFSFGEFELYADCRFVHNEYFDPLVHEGKYVKKLINFYIYDTSLYKNGSFVSDGLWNFGLDIFETEKEIYDKLKRL